MPRSEYPPQRVCRERRTEVAGFWVTFLDFGEAADITPRFHAIIEWGEELGAWDGSIARDDWRRMIREVVQLCVDTRRLLNEAPATEAREHQTPPAAGPESLHQDAQNEEPGPGG